MPLTGAQLTALANDIAANTATAPGTSGQIKDLPKTPDNAFAVALWYNHTASPAFVVWRDLPMETVLGLISYANMTPVDAVPTDTALNVEIWQARSLACQGKQFNLQNLTIGRQTAPMKRTNYRAALHAMAAPHPKVLNLMSVSMPSFTLMYNHMTSPHWGFPTLPIPSASGISPTFLGFAK